jgi:hypothetical protein
VYVKEATMRVRAIVPVIALAALATPSAFASQGVIGRVKIATGIATIERGTQKIPAAPGVTLFKGDRLVTGKNGRIGVTFNDNTRFAAGPNSRVSVAEFAFNDTTRQGRFVTNVDKGSLAIVSGHIAKSEKDAMRVRTPTALLGVRGTRFVVEVD